MWIAERTGGTKFSGQSKIIMAQPSPPFRVIRAVTDRAHKAAAVTDFVQRALVSGTLDVTQLEAMARAAGLLGKRQQIQHAKAFKKAKKSLGIRSVRAGFGSLGKWAWLLAPKPTKPAL